MLSAVPEISADLCNRVLVSRGAKGNTAGLGRFLDARRYVYPVTVNVAAFDDDVA